MLRTCPFTLPRVALFWFVSKAQFFFLKNADLAVAVAVDYGRVSISHLGWLVNLDRHLGVRVHLQWWAGEPSVTNSIPIFVATLSVALRARRFAAAINGGAAPNDQADTDHNDQDRVVGLSP